MTLRAAATRKPQHLFIHTLAMPLGRAWLLEKEIDRDIMPQIHNRSAASIKPSLCDGRFVCPSCYTPNRHGCAFFTETVPRIIVLHIILLMHHKHKQFLKEALSMHMKETRLFSQKEPILYSASET